MNSRHRSRVKSNLSPAAACLILLVARTTPSRQRHSTRPRASSLPPAISVVLPPESIRDSPAVPSSRSGARDRLLAARGGAGAISSQARDQDQATRRLAGNRWARSISPRATRSRCSSRTRRPRTKGASGTAAAGLLYVAAGHRLRRAAPLDLVRGRVDSIEPTHDAPPSPCPNQQRRHRFSSAASAAAWNDRAQHLREQMLVTLGLWPMFPKTPLNPRINGKLDRGDYTIEKVVLETFPGFTLSGNLTGRPARPARCPGSLPAWPLGGRPREPGGAAALHSLGQARLCGLHVRHGRIQRQQAVSARIPERSPEALGA